MKFDELDHNTLTIIQSMLLPSDSANLHLVSKKIHENLGEKYVIYKRKNRREKETSSIKFYNIQSRKDFYILATQIDDELLDELEELFGTYEIYPLNYKNHKNVSYIKFDKEISDSNNFKDFMINNLINIYKLSTGLAFFKFKPDIFYGKLERSENIFNFPRINSNNSNFDNLIRDFSFEIYKKRLILKKFVSGHHNITNYFASEVTTKLTEINDFYYILFIPQTAKIDRTNLILFNRDFILSLNLYLDDDIKVCDYLTANYFTNIKKVIVINTDNDPESDWLNTFRIIYIDNNDMVDGIFMKENSKQVNLYKHRYLIDDEIFEENITIDLIDEKIYLIGDLDRKFSKDINLDETEVVDVINLFN